MSYTPTEPHGGLRPLVSRDPKAAYRAATPLELFYDLVFVIAIAAAAGGLHHEIAEGHIRDGIARFAFIFLAIWWPWLNHTWFASAFDNDDALYRIAVFTQMVGVLILSAGVEDMYAEFDLKIALIGYIVMRLSMVTLWLRVAKDDSAMHPAALRYAIGITLCQIGWTLVILFAQGEIYYALIAALWLTEFITPMIAERKAPTPWRRHHVVERYGLMTIIVLGEGVLAGSVAVSAIEGPIWANPGLWSAFAGGLMILFSMWWLYFGEHRHSALDTLPGAFLWGYSHYLIFASAAAVGAGLAVVVDYATHHAEISGVVANASVAIPVAVYLLMLSVIHKQDVKGVSRKALPAVGALAALATPGFSHGVLLTGIILILCVIAQEMTEKDPPDSA